MPLIFIALLVAGLLLISAFMTVVVFVVFLACTISGIFSLFFTVIIVAAIVLLFRDSIEFET